MRYYEYRHIVSFEETSVVRQKFVSVSAGVRFRRRLVVERCNSPFSRAPIGRAGVSWCNTSMAW